MVSTPARLHKTALASGSSMGRATFTTAIVAGALAGSLVLASPAQADDASYLASLNKRGVKSWDVNPNKAVFVGHWFCRQLQAGRPFNDAHSDLMDWARDNALNYSVATNIAGAAWNNLCREFEWEGTHTILDYYPPNQRTPAVK
ncbi:DUF732 domain-containing protein [Mycolicibacterium sp. 141076]|uniref:DUF732 domain-containing protein n=1 Tax=Mycolicibacterium sp. 141076 TaxID=3090599 RepID=UPI00299EE020|nr:DUF732 domain-containing protein [Mycolicibacterium sp. 141076]MDX1879767.1 DUF732 domain-containing protein [Mycolicibacterium sp. 141076]